MQAVEWLSHAEGGTGPQQRMFDEADALQKDVFVARDASFGKGAKEYASLQNHEQLAKLLLSSLDRECCMYELVREGRPCKLYLDLEWESEKMVAADAHRVLTNVVAKLHAFLQVRRSMPSSRRFLHAQKKKPAYSPACLTLWRSMLPPRRFCMLKKRNLQTLPLF
jgi:hypothetical protein